MSALIDFVEVHQGGIGTARPALRGLDRFRPETPKWQPAAKSRTSSVRRQPAGFAPCSPRTAARRMSRCSSAKIQRDVVEDRHPASGCRPDVPSNAWAMAAITILLVVDHPGRQSRRRIGRCVTDRLWPCAPIIAYVGALHLVESIQRVDTLRAPCSQRVAPARVRSVASALATSAGSVAPGKLV